MLHECRHDLSVSMRCRDAQRGRARRVHCVRKASEFGQEDVDDFVVPLLRGEMQCRVTVSVDQGFQWLVRVRIVIRGWRAVIVVVLLWMLLLLMPEQCSYCGYIASHARPVERSSPLLVARRRGRPARQEPFRPRAGGPHVREPGCQVQWMHPKRIRVVSALAVLQRWCLCWKRSGHDLVMEVGPSVASSAVKGAGLI